MLERQGNQDTVLPNLGQRPLHKEHLENKCCPAGKPEIMHDHFCPEDNILRNVVFIHALTCSQDKHGVQTFGQLLTTALEVTELCWDKSASSDLSLGKGRVTEPSSPKGV